MPVGVASALWADRIRFSTQDFTMNKSIPFLLAAALAASALAASAQVSVNINVPGLVQVAPPAPRYERMPGPRAGQVWVPGHWQWGGRDYVWRGGYWQTGRPDYAYAPGRWVQADGGWRWHDGDWRRAERREERRHDRHDRREDRHDRYEDRRDDRHGGYHCPPGQAKKGNC
jgi:WXXGXW repeat (2 copies)